jgi:hypothetical protein
MSITTTAICAVFSLVAAKTELYGYSLTTAQLLDISNSGGVLAANIRTLYII